MELAERKKIILGAIVETYITTGEPVGSKAVAALTGMGLSPATIRNEMSELAELGFLEQPHTSAGRVPSQLGYRFYIDRLMEKKQLTPREMQRIDSLLKFEAGDIESLLEDAGKILAEVTGLASLSTVSGNNAAELRRVELVPAGRRAVLLILITSTGAVRSSLCRTEEPVTPQMISYFVRLVNDKLSGMSLESVTSETIEELYGELYEYSYALKPVLERLGDEIGELVQSEVFVGGEANLLKHGDLDSTRLREILGMFEQGANLSALFDSIKAGGKHGVQVRIGTENGIGLMDASSVVAAPYAFKGEAYGAIGVIGPTRMDYAKVISNLEYFSMALSRIINDSFGAF